ncbi:MAG TPA: hypothetical protein VMV45_05140 [Casimicrobiaceae bacterium]|nr:hypothetical protein [Casimicrobiaceae bacterium]
MRGFQVATRSAFARIAVAAGLAAAAVGVAAEVPTQASCKLDSVTGTTRRVVYIQFDNTHFLRDLPNVPSDLEQMPHLLDFIKGNGTLLTNDHTILISHTAGGILSSLTGVYPDRHGQTVSNSYVRTSSTGAFSFPSSFGYWTDPVSATNTATVPNMITRDGKNAPAPWVPYTRAGCDVGAIASANIVLENTGTGPTGDITKVFGNPSPQYTEALASNAAPAGSADRSKAQTDFVGFAVHCAQGSPLCANGHDDQLPDEPGGYSGFKGLFGAQEINPILAGRADMNDLLGEPIVDPFKQPGFPGFDGMSAAVSLRYVAAMLEKGIPVVYAYISDAHDFHGVSGNAHTAYGPGDAGYVAQLKSYDDAFAAFFDRLAREGITRDNTLFVFTVDEGDHFVGVRKSNCDGVSTPCVYGDNEVGEINTNIDALVADQYPSLGTSFLANNAPYAFTVHGDDAPPFYLAARGSGPLAQHDPVTRDFERKIATLTAANPYTGKTDRLMVQMADQVGMRALHMVADADPARNATFVLFADANYFLTDFPTSTCKTCINPAFAWNHGDIQPEIATTWIGLVGPGVNAQGTSDLWTDHTDVRPTMFALLGLSDSYLPDGRVLTEMVAPRFLSASLKANPNDLGLLGQTYKRINAPFGEFAAFMLAASTRALASGSAGDDSTYLAIESQIASLTSTRDAVADQMKSMLFDAAFKGKSVDPAQAQYLILQGRLLLYWGYYLAQP